MTPFLCLTLSLLAQPAAPLRFHESRQIVAQLPADQAAKLPAGRLTAEQGENILVVALVDDATKKPGPAGDTLVAMREQQERLASEMQRQRDVDRAELEQLRREVEVLKQQTKKGNG